MSKHDIIEKICESARGLSEEFLSDFTVEELDSYLENLLSLDLEMLAQCA